MSYLREKDQIIFSSENAHNDLLSEIKRLKNELFSAENYRALLHNQIQELKGNLRIFCRIKPNPPPTLLLPSPPPPSSFPPSSLPPSSLPPPPSLPLPTDGIIGFPDKGVQGKGMKVLELKVGDKKGNAYFFDEVFEEEKSQIEIFEEIAPFVQSCIDGNQVILNLFLHMIISTPFPPSSLLSFLLFSYLSLFFFFCSSSFFFISSFHSTSYFPFLSALPLSL